MQNIVQGFYKWYKKALRNSKYRWLVVLGSLVYLVSPLDISPDFMPIVGWLDDGVIATLLVAEVSQMGLEFLKNRKRTFPNQNVEVINDDVITVEAR